MKRKLLTGLLMLGLVTAGIGAFAPTNTQADGHGTGYILPTNEIGPGYIQASGIVQDTHGMEG